MTAQDLASCDVLRPYRAEVLERWRLLVYDSYPEEAVRFFRKEKDGFKNPVGRAIQRATEVLLDGVLLGRGGQGVPEALEGLVRIRAVQDFAPSEAVAFVFLLKRAAREVLEEASAQPVPAQVAAHIETRVDTLALMAFETYTRCREEIFEIRVREAQRRTAALLERFNRETPAGEAAPDADHRQRGFEA
jgi:hypothetical protein